MIRWMDGQRDVCMKLSMDGWIMLTRWVKVTRSTTIWTHRSLRKRWLAIEVSGAKHESALEWRDWPRMSFSCRKTKEYERPLKANEAEKKVFIIKTIPVSNLNEKTVVEMMSLM